MHGLGGYFRHQFVLALVGLFPFEFALNRASVHGLIEGFLTIFEPIYGLPSIFLDGLNFGSVLIDQVVSEIFQL